MLLCHQDCALSDMIALGKMGPSDIFVYSRAIEDAIDLILMRSRNEAELSRMQTEIERLETFRDVVDSKLEPRLVPCQVDSSNPALVLGNLHYQRGPAEAKVFNVTIGPGVYALTGANGSGKSVCMLSSRSSVFFSHLCVLCTQTLFRILMSCDSNANPVDLPTNIVLPALDGKDGVCLNDGSVVDGHEADCPATSIDEGTFTIVLPSSDVIEISQTFYWPLHAKPIDWIAQDSGVASESLITQVAEQLHTLEFFQANQQDTEGNSTYVSNVPESDSAVTRIIDELISEKDDWFSALSGGQKSKVELVRLVFLKDECPSILLIDETFAPLDPVSKKSVMEKLKNFCSKSIIIVIYHADIDTDGRTAECIASANFFDKNIHLESGRIQIRNTCESNEMR